MDEEALKKLINDEIDIRVPPPMTDEDKSADAKSSRDLAHSNQQFAEARSEDASGEFTRLEIQMATFLFAFSGFFAASFQVGGALDFAWMKLMFSFSMAFLIISLVMGLLQFKITERFWDERLNQRNLRFHEWKKAVRRKVSFEEAAAFEAGTVLDKGRIVSVPRWAWVLQTIFLGTAVGFLFVLFLVSLFASGVN